MCKKKFSFMVAVAFLLISMSGTKMVWAGIPMNTIREGTDEVISILKNPQYKGTEHTKVRREKIWEVISQYFDFPEMARRALGRHWRKISPAQRTEFVDLFSHLLQRTYIRKIDRYTDEKVVYGTEILDGKYAIVKTTIISKNDVEIPVDYRLKKKVKGWMVYDVVVEGVSLVNNYRTQFNNVIVTKSYKTLVKKLRMKKTKAEETEQSPEISKKEEKSPNSGTK